MSNCFKEIGRGPDPVVIFRIHCNFDPAPGGCTIDFSVEFPHPIFGAENKRVVIDFVEESYLKEISRARTFTFMHEVETMREIGLALGGSLDNAIVLDDFGVLNSDTTMSVRNPSGMVTSPGWLKGTRA